LNGSPACKNKENLEINKSVSRKLGEMKMRTDFDFPQKNLIGPVVFRPDFNNFETINANQAWSLFFTAGQEDKALGLNAELGKFFTYLLIAIAATGTLGGSIFTNLL
jgi:hypothetical protein